MPNINGDRAMRGFSRRCKRYAHKKMYVKKTAVLKHDQGLRGEIKFIQVSIELGSSWKSSSSQKEFSFNEGFKKFTGSLFLPNGVLMVPSVPSCICDQNGPISSLLHPLVRIMTRVSSPSGSLVVRRERFLQQLKSRPQKREEGYSAPGTIRG